jgi:hypothetical protein
MAALQRLLASLVAWKTSADLGIISNANTKTMEQLTEPQGTGQEPCLQILSRGLTACKRLPSAKLTRRTAAGTARKESSSPLGIWYDCTLGGNVSYKGQCIHDPRSIH